MQPDENDIIFNKYSVDFGELFSRLYEFMGVADKDSIIDTLGFIWDVFSIIALIISAIFIFGIIYTLIRIEQTSELEMKQVKTNERLYRELHGRKNKIMCGMKSVSYTHLRAHFTKSK